MKENNNEIDIIDLIKALIKNVKWIVIAVIVGAVILGGYKYYKDMKAIEAAANHTNGASIEDMVSALTSDEKLLVENIAKQTYEMQKRNEFYNSSILMRLDAANVKSIKISFMIDSYEDTARVADIKKIYEEYLGSSEFATSLKDALGLDYSAAEINELIRGVALDDAADKAESAILEFNMYITDKMDSAQIIDFVKNSLEEKRSRINAICPHDLVAINENVNTIVDEVLKKYQSEYALSDVQDAYYILTIQKDRFTYGQDEYYEYLMDTYNEAGDMEISQKAFVESGAAEKISNKESNDAVIATKPNVSVKFILIGMLIGAILASGVIIAKESYKLGK